MKIERIDLWHVDVPLPVPFRPAWIPGYLQTGNRFTLIRLSTSSGLQGWSAAPAMGREREGLGELLGPYLLGERADDLPSIQQRIREMSYLGWRNGWIEPACWDLIGKAAGVPVYALLGARGGSVRCYASTGEVCSAAARAEEVRARLDEGFSAVKLRVHADTLEQDLAHIQELRSRVGDGVQLGVDANQGWRVAVIADAPRWTFERAVEFCKVAAELGFAWVEEPLAFDAYDDIAALRRRSRVPLAGGELNHQGLPELSAMLERGCYDIYQPDAIMTGGIAQTFEFARRVEAAELGFTPHTWTNGIGLAVNLQLFAATRSRERELLEYPLAPPGWIPAVRDALLERPWTHTSGRIELPLEPGLGFSIDRRALARHGRRFFTATPTRVAVRTVLDKGLATARELGAVRERRLAARAEQLEVELGERTPAQLGLRWAMHSTSAGLAEI
ncbi:MAG: mandelate racemase/muconate lactonizing enzyme family protein [Enhygromyxa sp.]